ncbi:MAG TPA: UbiA family prenyltransferase [Candidatus Omnitrophota bacterium]|nr:UbiA family prenyltransferase [Candidatus Omnitrophota bacterium]HPT39208.1 UbiA family prenyltransferase [Candidatus Omnitrophota bacterium]
MKPPDPVHNNCICEFLVFIRITDWLHILGLAVLGVAFSSASSLFTFKTLLALTVSALYLAHGFSLNNYFDAAIDQRINKVYFPAGPISRERFLIFSYSLFLINCFIASRISVTMLYFIVAGSLLALIYSAPPLRFKKSTLLNIVLNSLGFAIIFLIGFISVGNFISAEALMMSVLLALVFIPLQIVHQIAHSEADKIENILSVYNRYGLQPTIYLINLSLAGLLLWSLFIGISSLKYAGVFYLTCLFCFSLFYYLRRVKNSPQAHPEAAAKLRIIIRRICILYGTGLLLSFYFIK